MVRRHVEGPFEGFDLHARGGGGHDEACYALGVAGCAARPGEEEHVCGRVHARLPHLVAVDGE